jgi:putative transposase
MSDKKSAEAIFKKCEWQEIFSKEAKEDNSFDCTHDWYDGRLCECGYIGEEEKCSHYRKDAEKAPGFSRGDESAKNLKNFQKALDNSVDKGYTINIMEYKYSRNQVFLINYHLIWCPKRRKPVLIGEVSDRLKSILKEVAKERGVEIIALEIQPDHVHLFISAYPTLAVHKFVKAFKGRSSHHLRKEFPHLLKIPSLWTHSYFVSTAGNISNETIRKYIEAQSRI